MLHLLISALFAWLVLNAGFAPNSFVVVLATMYSLISLFCYFIKKGFSSEEDALDGVFPCDLISASMNTTTTLFCTLALLS